MRNEGIFELVAEWKSERDDYLSRAEKARTFYFESHPDDPPGRPATGDWLHWEDKATTLDQRIEALERAILATVPTSPVEICRPESPAELDSPRRRELETMLSRMAEIVSRFYFEAIAVGNHPFIEWTGLLNEYVRMCEQALADGIDFTACNEHSGRPLPIYEHQFNYLAEKLGCVFGPSFQANPVAFESFVRRLRAK